MILPRFAACALTSLCVLSTGCASSSKPADESGAVSPRSESASTNRLAADEIEKSGLPTAFDAVDRLRPTWKHDYSTGASAAVVVYLEQRKLGGLEALRDIASSDVRELQYLNGRDATQRWGPDASGGAIIVVRK